MATSFNPRKAYDAGLVGCSPNPRGDELFADSILRAGGNPDGGAVASQWELVGAGKGELTLLFPAVEKVFPGCWPGPTQVRGDCVAKATANAIVSSLALEIVSSKPDEVTGRIEAAPDLPREGVLNIPVASESLWAFRGYDGDGWYGSGAAKIATENGFLVRKPYPELKIDLTRYTEETTNIGGSRVPGEAWLKISKEHRPRTATVLTGKEMVRDFLAAGFGILNTSSMAFSAVRDDWARSEQRGVWQHAQTFCGWDERPETIKKWGQPLVLWLNQWSAWNKGPRRIHGTEIDIPEGAYWALSDTVERCQCIAFSSVAGWPRRKHTTYGAEGNI
jgi:hypothetical protein